MDSRFHLLVVALVQYFVCSSAEAPADAEDFDLKRDDYEFIFHDEHNLLLIIHADTCYFNTWADAKDQYILDQEAQIMIADYLAFVVERGASKNMHDRTLPEMRSQYGDMLADFHCMDKNIQQMTTTYDDWEEYQDSKGEEPDQEEHHNILGFIYGLFHRH